ncbi:MAG: helix-turn-helix transcriptional regulator [Ruminococcus sp.]|nr:helix-turn-helix transcriptional regulator [Candidatus Copronaster equi]
MPEKNIFIERLHSLMKDRSVTKNKLQKDLGLNKSNIVNWEQRGTIPSGDILNKIAEYFSVSVDYLLGKEKSPSKAEELLEKYGGLITALESLPEDKRHEALQKIQAIAKGSQ